MKRVSSALGVGLLLALLVGPAWAGGFRGGFHSGGARVFIGHGRPFVHDRFFHDRFFFDRRFSFGRPFVHREFFVPSFSSTVIVGGPVAVVEPFPARVWVPGFWQWNGFQWLWVPGHWTW